MTTIGIDQPPCILPFGHRGSFQRTMFGWERKLTPDHTAQIRCCQAGHLRWPQGGRGDRRPEGAGRHPGGRAVQGRHPARRRS